MSGADHEQVFFSFFPFLQTKHTRTRWHFFFPHQVACEIYAMPFCVVSNLCLEFGQSSSSAIDRLNARWFKGEIIFIRFDCAAAAAAPAAHFFVYSDFQRKWESYDCCLRPAVDAAFLRLRRFAYHYYSIRMHAGMSQTYPSTTLVRLEYFVFLRLFDVNYEINEISPTHFSHCQFYCHLFLHIHRWWLFVVVVVENIYQKQKRKTLIRNLPFYDSQSESDHCVSVYHNSCKRNRKPFPNGQMKQKKKTQNLKKHKSYAFNLVFRNQLFE